LYKQGTHSLVEYIFPLEKQNTDCPQHTLKHAKNELEDLLSQKLVHLPMMYTGVHHQCINGRFTAESLGPVATGSP
jgi:hypothetical protein